MMKRRNFLLTKEGLMREVVISMLSADGWKISYDYKYRMKYGSPDLIFKKGDELALVEVKTYFDITNIMYAVGQLLFYEFQLRSLGLTKIKLILALPVLPREAIYHEIKSFLDKYGIEVLVIDIEKAVAYFDKKAKNPKYIATPEKIERIRYWLKWLRSMRERSPFFID